MRIYDISLSISPDLPTWPGDPPVNLEQVSSLEAGDESNVTRVSMGLHTGTHVDAPYHFIPDGERVDEINLKTLTGRVYVLHLPDADLITAKILAEAEIPPRTRRLIFKTRNSEQWIAGNNTFDQNYIALSADGAQYLVDRGVKLVGVDYLSIAPYTDIVAPHEILLGAGIVVVEGLNLSDVTQGRYTLYCLPMKVAGAEGAPARAILIGV